mmetsp:Transcript_15357/g.22232  ORF Transcript_15357/g.22232 Transcript_15357/m.22232 type:complete len:273 (-) Transcript_15357:1088-1906(-)
MSNKVEASSFRASNHRVLLFSLSSIVAILMSPVPGTFMPNLYFTPLFFFLEAFMSFSILRNFFSFFAILLDHFQPFWFCSLRSRAYPAKVTGSSFRIAARGSQDTSPLSQRISTSILPFVTVRWFSTSENVWNSPLSSLCSLDNSASWMMLESTHSRPPCTYSSRDFSVSLLTSMTLVLAGTPRLSFLMNSSPLCASTSKPFTFETSTIGGALLVKSERKSRLTFSFSLPSDSATAGSVVSPYCSQHILDSKSSMGRINERASTVWLSVRIQ